MAQWVLTRPAAFTAAARPRVCRIHAQSPQSSSTEREHGPEPQSTSEAADRSAKDRRATGPLLDTSRADDNSSAVGPCCSVNDLRLWTLYHGPYARLSYGVPEAAGPIKRRHQKPSKKRPQQLVTNAALQAAHTRDAQTRARAISAVALQHILMVVRSAEGSC
eukprot:TRINITY_DN16513_c0_g1_i1.p1 TRINITY_DN16513_c0_g1~~TRINITY_DN16513_c0_g1_i1.p1  ORF type:complete len:163 (+),score=10.30 TRINITY_DN16513_c0_g1_i1:243-731(+)